MTSTHTARTHRFVSIVSPRDSCNVSQWRRRRVVECAGPANSGRFLYRTYVVAGTRWKTIAVDPRETAATLRFRFGSGRQWAKTILTGGQNKVYGSVEFSYAKQKFQDFYETWRLKNVSSRGSKKTKCTVNTVIGEYYFWSSFLLID